jgi:short-subunit dehydrogenase
VRGNARKRHSAWKTRRRFPIFSRIAYYNVITPHQRLIKGACTAPLRHRLNMVRVCIVTGASRGFGRGIAKILATEKGCVVYATARDLGALQTLAEEVSDSDGKVVPYQLDQTDDDAVRAFVARVTAAEGKIDLLVNSAFQGLVAATPHFGKTFWEKPLSMYEAQVTQVRVSQ